jgi:hypothetical protein
MLKSDDNPPVSNDSEPLASCTPFEFEILKLAKTQLTSSPHGGTFTPGYVRKETSKGYNAINATLASLTRYGLLERGSHISQRDGKDVEISLYKLTGAGEDALKRLEAGSLKVEERATAPAAKRADRLREAGGEPDLSETIKKLEEDVAAILKALDSLHSKIEGLGAAGVGQPRSEPKRARRSDVDSHTKIILEALRDLAGNSHHALSQDVERMYGKNAGDSGLKAGSGIYFKNIIVDLEKDGHLKRKYVGCRALGIRGHGSRLVLEITPKGLEHLEKL